MKRVLSILICIIVLCPLFCIEVSAGKSTVVFLRDGGAGDGSSLSKPVGTLSAAYDALDLSKDCTIVICNNFTQTANFTYGKEYSGSVRFTSVYDGVDYSKKYGAKYISKAQRFVMYGETIFDDIDLKLTGNYFFIIANCHPITLTENFNPIYTKKVSGNFIDSGVSILGGYQNAQDMPEFECYNDININVLGGKNICIVAFNRAIKHAYHFGTANITVGGKAQVGTIRYASVDADDIISGNVNITVKDSAQVGFIRTGNGKNLDVNSLVVNWEGGTISNFIPYDEYEIDGVIYQNSEFNEGSFLRYSAATHQSVNFKGISELFENAVLIGSAEDKDLHKQYSDVTSSSSVTVTDELSTDDPGTVGSVSEDIYDIPNNDSSSTEWESIIIIAGSALVAVCLIVIVLLIRKK